MTRQKLTITTSDNKLLSDLLSFLFEYPGEDSNKTDFTIETVGPKRNSAEGIKVTFSLSNESQPLFTIEKAQDLASKYGISLHQLNELLSEYKWCKIKGQPVIYPFWTKELGLNKHQLHELLKEYDETHD